MILELKVPVVPVTVAVEFDIVGFALVFQQTPREVIAPPPSLVTFPPQVAEIVFILVTEFVVIVGAEGREPIQTYPLTAVDKILEPF